MKYVNAVKGIERVPVDIRGDIRRKSMNGFKILATADWHIGTFKGPEVNGVNLRSLDTKKCLEAMVFKAEEERPELILVSGDIFHTGKTWSDRCCDEVITAIEIITRLSVVAGDVVVMRGTPNHDGDGPFKVLQAHFSSFENVHIAVIPQVIKTEYADIAVLPGFDRGTYRAKFPGLGKEEENEVFTQELGNIVMGLRAQCDSGKPAVLMAHYTVPGSNTESGQSQLLTQFEPIVSVECLDAANFDLVALGHIHRPQEVKSVKGAFYSGSINANNFNDEGQERGFWIHHFEQGAFGLEGMTFTDSEFIKTPYREFITYHFTDTEITALNRGNIDEVAMNYWRWNGAVTGKIVRILYECSAEKHKAFNTALLEKALYEDGAFYVSGITPEKIESSADRNDLSQETDPEANLRMYLEEKQYDPEMIERLVLKARPIIAEAIASDTAIAFSGVFTPLEIEVKNYRAYAEERFSFEDIQFCTINGQNGAGKSSLFMDAIIDCIFEEPREGKSTSVKVPWLRNEDSVRSGYITFSFIIGAKTYRITRTRAKSGKGTLNLAELVAGEWEDRSQEKFNDTQEDIEKLIGVDSMTFKSCALIMQDQYGLFLQAKKDERMVVLGNLLGLGIYGVMENISKDKAAELNRVIAGKKQSIKVQTDNILLAGHPAEELESEEIRLKDIEQRLMTKNLEKESTSTLLNAKKAAKERHSKLIDSIAILTDKKRITGQNRAQQDNIIKECEGILAEEVEISVNVEKYKELAELEKQLIEGATMYKAKIAEAVSVNAEIAGVNRDIEKYRFDLNNQTERLKGQAGPEEQELLKAKAAEYHGKKEQLDKMFLTSQEYTRLADIRDRKAYSLDSKRALYNERERALKGEQAALERKTALLEDSNCIDIENAKCRFLADAIEAKNLLKEYPEKFESLEIERNSVVPELEKQLKEAEAERDELGFSQAALEELQRECESLKPYENKYKAMQKFITEIALINVAIENLQSNLSQTEERLATLNLKAQGVEKEKEKYQDCFSKHEQVMKDMELLKIWIDREKQIPVAKERKDTAKLRLGELDKEIGEIDIELQEKQKQAQEELNAASGSDFLEEQVHSIQTDIDRLTKESKNLQMTIGGLKQKIEEIIRMKKVIEDIQKEIRDMAVGAADYEELKVAFSQDGIQHQIIRTVIPKLSTTANNILGQMTGGQLGVDFVTEKTMKSNSKKEVVTLDIFIEEYGKSSLPYLSKSGGEKVKASLSVILALAEIKASTAGIQFGMLFIDEPPFLDADGVQAYVDALETIRKRYSNIKIMAITHDPVFKSRFPQSIDVIKTNKGSKVFYE